MDYALIETEFRRLCLSAGAAIMEVFDRGDADVRLKADKSPVTQADEAADAIIAAGLASAFPDIPAVTEEQAHTHAVVAETFIIVDPLDGTKEFIRRGKDFTVNIALVESRIPTRGAVFSPAQRRLFMTNTAGQAIEELGELDTDIAGATRPIAASWPDDSGLMVVASKSHRDKATDDYIARYRVRDFTSAGSSLKFCLVATGAAHLYPRLGPTMEWDTAAGDAVLRAAGGRMVDFETHHPFAYGKPGYRNGFFIACAPGVELIKG